MTPEARKELRQAAERVLQPFDFLMDGERFQTAPRSGQFCAAAEALARAYLSANPADGEELIDAAWLESLGWSLRRVSQWDDEWFGPVDGLRLCDPPSPFGYELRSREDKWSADIRTRAQLRALLAALQIETKEKT